MNLSACADVKTCCLYLEIQAIGLYQNNNVKLKNLRHICTVADEYQFQLLLGLAQLIVITAEHIKSYFALRGIVILLYIYRIRYAL